MNLLQYGSDLLQRLDAAREAFSRWPFDEHLSEQEEQLLAMAAHGGPTERIEESFDYKDIDADREVISRARREVALRIVDDDVQGYFAGILADRECDNPDCPADRHPTFELYGQVPEGAWGVVSDVLSEMALDARERARDGE